MTLYGKQALAKGTILYGIPNGYRVGIPELKTVTIETVGRKFINSGARQLTIEMSMAHYPQYDTLIASDSEYYYYKSEEAAERAKVVKQKGLLISKADLSLTGSIPFYAIEEIYETLRKYGAVSDIKK